MPTTPTPEEIQREQERLDLIQKQNEAAKELVSTYQKLNKTKNKLTDEEKEILGLTKQLAIFSSTIADSTQKRLNESSASKDIAKSIKQLEYDILQNERKYGDYVKDTNKQKEKALDKFKKYSIDERNIQ
jgi:hypothetical protein